MNRTMAHDADDLLDFLDDESAEAADVATDVRFEVVEKPANKPAEPPSDRKPAIRRRQPLYFDIETVGDTDREHLFGLDPLPQPIPLEECPAPPEATKGTVEEIKARLKGKTFPAEWCAACANHEATAQKPRKTIYDLFTQMMNETQQVVEGRRKLLSVTPEFCRVVSLAWAVGDEPVESLVVGQEVGVDEVSLLWKFWSLAKNASPVIGYNILHFDLPVIFVRSMLLGVAPTRQFDMKPWGGDVCDIFKVRFPSFGLNSKESGAGELKNLARVLGIPVDEEADGVDGSQVWKLWEAGEFEKLGAYNRSDVQLTRELHRKMRGYFLPA
jgi:hypothetical protein